MAQIDRGDDLHRLVVQTTRLVHRSVLLSGVAWVVSATVGWVLIGAVMDMLWPLGVPMRIVMHIGFWLVGLGGVALWIAWPALRQPRLLDIAARIERRIGGMHNRLITLLDLRNPQRNGSPSTWPDLIERLLTQTRQMLSTFVPSHMVDHRGLKRRIAMAMTIVLLSLVVLVVTRQSMPTALARLFFPTADIPPATWLRIETEGDYAILHGEPLTVQASITRGETQQATLQVRPTGESSQEWTNYPMQPAQAGFTFELPNVREDFEYRVRGGKTWTQTHRIRTLARPAITGIAVSVQMPPYLRIEESITIPPDTQQATVPEGAVVTFRATAVGEVDRGELTVLMPREIELEKTTESESIWIDDSLPDDSQSVGSWRWTTANVNTGVRAHRTHGSGELHGFRTRLHPLVVPNDAAFFSYVFLDPQQYPAQLALRLHTDKGAKTLVWGDETLPPHTTAEQMLHLGALPQAGTWVRLNAPLQELFASNPEGTKLVGVDFSSAGGSAVIDRIGAVRSITTLTPTTRLDPVGTVAMKQTQSGPWEAAVRVQDSAMIGLKMFNAQGHGSQDRKPFSITSKEDAPPMVAVEKPGTNIRIAELAPVPLSIRAFDDWALDQVGVEIAVQSDEWHKPIWLKKFDAVETSQLLLASIDLREFDLKVGQSLVYRVVATDRKGQESRSESYSISIVSPQQANQPDVVKKNDVLDAPRNAVSKLAEAIRRAVENVAEFLPDLPEDQSATPEEIRALADAHAEQLNQQQQQQIAAAAEQLDHVQQQLERASEQLSEAADAAEVSPLSSTLEAQTLREMSQQAMDLSQQLQQPSRDSNSPQAAASADVQRLLQAQQMAKDENAPLQELARNMEKADAARDAFAQDPQQGQEQLKDLLTEMAASQAENSLGEFEKALQEQQKKNQQLQQQPADARDPQQVQDALEKSDALTGDPPKQPQADAANPDEDALREQLQQRNESLQETGEESKELRELIEQLREMLNQQPQDEGDPADPSNQSEQGFDAQPATSPGSEPSPPAPSPGSQDQDPANASDPQAGSQPSPKGNSSEPSPDSSQSSPSASPGQGKPSTGEQLRDLLRQQRTQRLLRLAAQAQSAQAAQQAADQNGQPGSEPGEPGQNAQQSDSPGKPTGQVRGGTGTAAQPATRAVLILDGEVKANLSDRAKLYRLPPRLRDPLLQGMQEAGPEGYQPLIDAYYRELSRGVK